MREIESRILLESWTFSFLPFGFSLWKSLFRSVSCCFLFCSFFFFELFARWFGQRPICVWFVMFVLDWIDGSAILQVDDWWWIWGFSSLKSEVGKNEGKNDAAIDFLLFMVDFRVGFGFQSCRKFRRFVIRFSLFFPFIHLFLFSVFFFKWNYCL